MAGEKTEKASPKKRKDERKKGHTYSSKDVVNVVSILVTFFAISKLFSFMTGRISESLHKYVSYAAENNAISVDFAMKILRDVAITFIVVAIPSMLITMVVGVLATGVQTRFLFSAENLKPKFSRMNPLQGFKRMFSFRSLFEVLKSTLKILIIGYVLYNFIMGRVESFAGTLSIGVMQSVILILQSIMSLMYNICLIYVVIAVVDYVYQWWDFEKQLKMSKQEVKEEYKQMEGDPKVKGKIKEKQREFSMSRMMQAVPTADVVIRNPTHFAVALRYDDQKDNAPVVVAKGQDELALRIVRVATEHDVYVLENKDLTRAIYSTTEVNQEISMEYYNAVAEVLALVYKVKNKQI